MQKNQIKNIIKFLIIITIFISGFLFMGEKVMASSTPILHFSDMTDGPTTGWEGSSTKGAAVSIWGRNFGITRGNSYVTVGGVNLTNDSDYAEWGATTNPTTANGQQRITFYLNSSMSVSGDAPNTTITVTNSDGTSSSIPFHCRAIGSSHIYFVDDDGSDSNNGLRDTDEGSNVGPWATLEKVRTVVDAGDVVYFRSGIYTTIDTQYAPYKALMYCVDGNFNNGTAYNSITLTAYPGEVAQMGDGSDNVFSMFRHNQNTPNTIDYWTISKFKIVVYDYAIFLTNSAHRGDNHFRIIGLDATTTHAETGRGQILSISAGGQDSQDMRILGNYLHHAGKLNEDDSHGYKVQSMYLSGFGVHKYVEVGWNEMYKNNGNCQFYGHFVTDSIDRIDFHDNYLHDGGTTGMVCGGGDGSTNYNFVKNAYIYNNIIAGHQSIAIKLSDGSSGSHGGNYTLFNNVFYNNSRDPLSYREIQTVYQDSVIFRNNIVYSQNDVVAYFVYSSGPWSGDGSKISGSHNLWYGCDEPPFWDTDSLNSIDPLFSVVNPINFADFSLQSTSPAIDTGTSDVSSIVTKDFTGNSRPMDGDGDGTAEYDIGAYEYTGTYTPDITPPIRSNPSPTGEQTAGTTNTTISLTTNETATCKYSTTTGTTYDSMTGIFINTNSTTHSTIVSGLSNGNTYNYYIRCQDAETTPNQNTDDFTISFSIANTTYGILDFIQLVTDWLKNGIGLTTDINNDEVVNTRDLGVMMSNWRE